MKNKGFDCVEMKRRGAEAVYEIIKNLTVEEQLDFWRKGTEKLFEKQRKAQKTHNTPIKK